jgi:hypothetical protein
VCYTGLVVIARRELELETTHLRREAIKKAPVVSHKGDKDCPCEYHKNYPNLDKVEVNPS